MDFQSILMPSSMAIRNLDGLVDVELVSIRAPLLCGHSHAFGSLIFVLSGKILKIFDLRLIKSQRQRSRAHSIA